MAKIDLFRCVGLVRAWNVYVFGLLTVTWVFLGHFLLFLRIEFGSKQSLGELDLDLTLIRSADVLMHVRKICILNSEKDLSHIDHFFKQWVTKLFKFHENLNLETGNLKNLTKNYAWSSRSRKRKWLCRSTHSVLDMSHIHNMSLVHLGKISLIRRVGKKYIGMRCMQELFFRLGGLTWGTLCT